MIEIRPYASNFGIQLLWHALIHHCIKNTLMAIFAISRNTSKKFYFRAILDASENEMVHFVELLVNELEN